VVVDWSVVHASRPQRVLFGETRGKTLTAVALGVLLFAVTLSVSVVVPDVTTRLLSGFLWPLVALVVLAAGSHAYANRGVLPTVFLTTAPTYAVFVELVHRGNIAPTPYERALLEAAPLALLVGVPLGVLAAGLGYALRSVRA
jgi:hypothetical protein